MIKINLLPQKRGKRAGAVIATSEPGSRDIVIGFAVLAAAAAVVFFAVDQPRRSHLHELRDSNAQLQQEIAAKQKQLEPCPGNTCGYSALKKASAEADERLKGINRLLQAKVIPANVLHEVGEILTTTRNPTMTSEMATRVAKESNRHFDPTWDPNHVWLTGFSDKNGEFKLEGGAQAEVDITQLSKRLQASVYFDRVAEASEERVSDKESGITYYKFTITGKVAY
jgi:Tfp pilus assembly protein PilN